MEEMQPHAQLLACESAQGTCNPGVLQAMKTERVATRETDTKTAHSLAALLHYWAAPQILCIASSLMYTKLPRH